MTKGHPGDERASRLRAFEPIHTFPGPGGREGRVRVPGQCGVQAYGGSYSSVTSSGMLMLSFSYQDAQIQAPVVQERRVL